MYGIMRRTTVTSRLQQGLERLGFIPTVSTLSRKENIKLGFIQLVASATVIISGGHYDCTWGSVYASKLRTKMMAAAMLNLFGNPPDSSDPSPNEPNPFTDLNNK